MKHLKLIVTFLIISLGVNAQSVFSPLAKPKVNRSVVATAAEPTTMNAFRPVLNVASYSIPDNALLSGGGLSFQHLKFDAANNKWVSEWSINALAWYKASLEGQETAFAYGIAGGVLNNIIMIGAATDGKKVFATFGVGINLNN